MAAGADAAFLRSFAGGTVLMRADYARMADLVVTYGDLQSDDRDQEPGPGELSCQLAGKRRAHAGLTARIMAECRPGATWAVNVTDASPKPAAARPSMYSARDRAPAMQPTYEPAAARSTEVR